MNQRPRIPIFIPLLFGVMSSVSLIGHRMWATTRAVDAVHLLGTGMCYGAAIALFALSRRS